MEEDILIICECSSPEHQLLLRTIDGDEIYIDIHLSPLPFLQRVKYAIKYIFGYKCKYGAWDEIIVNKNKFKQIVKNIK